MNSCEYLAHISEDGREETVSQHLQLTAALAAEFAAAFGAEQQGRLAGMMHDIGKYSDAFQRRLNGSSEHVDHATAGAFECFKHKQIPAAFAVAGHHGGLPDGGSKGDTADQSSFWGRMHRAEQGKLEAYSMWPREMPQAKLPSFGSDRKAAAFFIRMLYSALVDADFLATEAFMDDKTRSSLESSMKSLKLKLDAYTSQWFPPQGALNVQRCAILKHCEESGETETPGLFSLTVPTGGGKTVASLAFALSHAKRYGLRRIVYVIPYTSIIEQTAHTFREILGEDAVLEHHSGVLYDITEEASPNTVRLAQACENWDVPVVVTTAVQFFESLYSNRSSKCRKLHNLAQSVIVFDEAQMLPIPYLRPCVYAITELVRNYQVSAVLCTATQPSLKGIIQEFCPEQKMTELCPADLYDPETFQRVTFQRAGQLSWDELAQRLKSYQQVLCVVNTRAAAQEVYSRLRGEGTFHLSTLMYPAHRQAVLAEIRRRLKEGRCCRVISTSLIEAGVDVDFPAVFREQAGLDSVLQAAGRCNRERKRLTNECVVTIFKGEGKTPPLFSIPIAAAESTMQNYEDISCADAIHFYFNELLNLKGKEAQDKADILGRIETENYPFASVAEAFHLIDSLTKTVYIPLNEGAEYAQRVKNGEYSRSLLRKLGQYGVSVYEKHFNELYAAGALEQLPDGSAILMDTSLYDEKTGLSLTADDGKALFV